MRRQPSAPIRPSGHNLSWAIPDHSSCRRVTTPEHRDKAGTSATSRVLLSACSVSPRCQGRSSVGRSTLTTPAAPPLQRAQNSLADSSLALNDKQTQLLTGGPATDKAVLARGCSNGGVLVAATECSSPVRGICPMRDTRAQLRRAQGKADAAGVRAKEVCGANGSWAAVRRRRTEAHTDPGATNTIRAKALESRTTLRAGPRRRTQVVY